MLQPWHAMTMSSLYHPFAAFCRRKRLVVRIQLMYLPTAHQSLAGPWLDTYAGARFSLDLKTAAVHTRTHTHTLYTPVPTTFLSATFVHHLLSSTCSVFLYHPVWGYNALLSSIFLPSSELFFIDPWLFLRHWWQIAFEESLFQAYLAWAIIAFHLLPLPRRRDMQLEQFFEAASAPVSEVKHFNANISKRPFANQ